MTTIEPNGHFVLIEIMKVENKTESGIYLGDEEREQGACEFGVVRAFGPTAFIGIAGCEPTDYPTGHPNYNKTRYQIWGIDVGDQVEFKRYEGKASGVKGVGNMRYVPDNQIIGKITGEIRLTKVDI